MDFPSHALAQGAIHELMAGEPTLAGELACDDARSEVGVVVRLHEYLGTGQPGTDQLGDLFGIHEAILADIIAGMSPTPEADALLATARRALGIEARAVQALAERLDQRFVDACNVCLACKGRVVVTGMGKSGHVARKVASTLASTGTPAFFLHPAEAHHGDLGMITRGDVLLALSNSGETPELVLLLPHLKRMGVPLITMSGKPASTLARASAVMLDVSVSEEACPLNLAPTASTAASLAMGDALAVALLEARGFTAQDFALSHPGGTLGRKLFVRVEDVMRTGADLPRIRPEATLAEGLLEMSRKGLGMAVIVDAEERVLGIFTDGDLRRTLDRQVDVHTAIMSSIMTTNCKTIGPHELAAEGVHLMELHRITVLPVVDATRKLIGAFNVHDLLRAGVV
jgi:arabinose-5-phosphate isomerase